MHETMKGQVDPSIGNNTVCENVYDTPRHGCSSIREMSSGKAMENEEESDNEITDDKYSRGDDQDSDANLNSVAHDFDMTDWLCSKGLTINGKDINGLTPMHCAAAEGRLDVMMWLEPARKQVD